MLRSLAPKNRFPKTEKKSRLGNVVKALFSLSLNYLCKKEASPLCRRFIAQTSDVSIAVKHPKKRRTLSTPRSIRLWSERTIIFFG